MKLLLSWVLMLLAALIFTYFFDEYYGADTKTLRGAVFSGLLMGGACVMFLIGFSGFLGYLGLV